MLECHLFGLRSACKSSLRSLFLGAKFSEWLAAEEASKQRALGSRLTFCTQNKLEEAKTSRKHTSKLSISLKTAPTRTCRIIPTFGFGTLINNEIRSGIYSPLTRSWSLAVLSQGTNEQLRWDCFFYMVISHMLGWITSIQAGPCSSVVERCTRNAEVRGSIPRGGIVLLLFLIADSIHVNTL